MGIESDRSIFDFARSNEKKKTPELIEVEEERTKARGGSEQSEWGSENWMGGGSISIAMI